MYPFLKNVFKFLLIGSLPIWLLLAGYIVFDPFKVLRDYEDFSYPKVLPNRDYISTEMFLQNYQKYSYNSFIFGSSRTLAFSPESWARHLPEGSSPYVFDASGESIYGINKKIKLIDQLGVKIENALIILCLDVSFQRSANHEGHLYIKHPEVSKENPLIFHQTFLKAYSNPSFLMSYYDYQITKEFKPYMLEYLENRNISYDRISNKMIIEDQNQELALNEEAYYKNRDAVFYQRNETQFIDTVRQINATHEKLLTEIRNILDAHQAQYKVIISPLFDQIKFNPVDLKILENFFGENLYDFSGKNNITDEKTNYYESSHYRPIVGDSILRFIYSQNHQ